MGMERQRSFSLKPSHFLVFSFIFTSSLLLLFFFKIHLDYSSQSSRSFTHYNASSLSSFQIETSQVRIFTISSKNFSVVQMQTPKLPETQVLKSAVFKFNQKNTNLSTGFNGSNSSVNRKSEINGSTSSGTRDGEVSQKKASSGTRDGEIKGEKECDIYTGKWVFDETYPLYSTASCPFIDDGFNCEANGRPDRDYMKWRWQPRGCSIPRFSAVNMLKLLRGKRLVFVGDSINRNQWESMLCLLRSSIPDPKRVFEARGRKITKEKGIYNFKFVDYGCSVEYYVTHFLVHESKARVGPKRVQTLRIDTIDRGSSRWKKADILVFNTAHWWTHTKTKAGGGQWNAGGHCNGETQPLRNYTNGEFAEKLRLTEEVIKEMRTPVTVLNITDISGLRVDGHPSVYGRKPGVSPSSSVQDCSHWCLPGVPDTWNELLYFLLVSKRREVSTK
ncbi:protein trichome birefringence-like 6 isoform X2 [Amborella trichopoda]|uniref:protein trichome birefringence-like 6 isoform X2 n=1 Tax=Amborella trichopoda TaxID=13333 RepID=UPI0009BEF7C1|nr:protein trichome birefringence-like 6 isoform X2 [Amborella trichopoda]|eukprot:XP_020520624.1 protein trichome birefringence-like 6 isoform X2 [Amborella trichopoda]